MKRLGIVRITEATFVEMLTKTFALPEGVSVRKIVEERDVMAYRERSSDLLVMIEDTTGERLPVVREAEKVPDVTLPLPSAVTDTIRLRLRAENRTAGDFARIARAFEQLDEAPWRRVRRWALVALGAYLLAGGAWMAWVLA